MLFLTLIIILVVFIYTKVSKAHKYWKEKGIRYMKPWPIFGFIAATVFRFKSFPDLLRYTYNTFPEQRYFGIYQFLKPGLVVRDPELIKRIMVKEFEVFPQHRAMIDPEGDTLWSKNLFAMRGGAEWRDMRATLSPMFTSSKMRAMFVLMRECAQNFVDHFLGQGGSPIEVELKDATTRFANDIIASAAFGISCDSLREPNNEFHAMMKNITGFKFLKTLKFFAYAACPALAKFFKFSLIEPEVKKFYMDIVKETIRVRQEKGIVRPDMIHLLTEARKGRLAQDDELEMDESNFAVVQDDPNSHERIPKRRKAEITDEDITAQAVLFFFAGFETVSIAMSHLIYELVLNPELQEKLRLEIDQVAESFDGNGLSYEALLKMKYLDMVVSETLRKWPPAVANDRESVRPFTIEPTKVWEKTVCFEAGTLFMFPVYAIHRDPKIYPNPDEFDPERFSDENKGQIKPFTYLPFGVGPRSCIGSRFALLEIKTLVFCLLSKFEAVPIAKTKNPLVLSRKLFNPVPDDGFWIGLRRRTV